ncbi:hypothetical protein Lal_00048951 [Lupinus albus]|nr:hypothetical protein Lal_00048951 [Lupinus albus]
MKQPLVPLATLIGRDVRNLKIEKPIVKYGQAGLARKGEDYFLIKTDCQRIPGDSSTLFSVFAILDGHNGMSAAVFVKENILRNVMSAIPQDISRDEWLQALPRALVVGFVKTDIEFQKKDTQGGVVSLLTVDHRLDENVEERERVTASGGEALLKPHMFWFLNTSKGLFAAGLLSNAGGRLIIASDGIWDALSSDVAAKSCRGLPAELAAKLVAKEALRSRGLKDDTTCLVVDIIPSDYPVIPTIPRKKYNMLISLLFRKKSQNSSNKASNKLSAVGVVEELFEGGSAVLTERLGKESPFNMNSGIFRCAVCQVNQPPGDGLAVNCGPFFPSASKSREGPFLCTNCRKKKDAMEGKRPSIPIVDSTA